ncbi:MAG: hypothetical protein R6V58_14760, partial [Planctomycetota bacterium]
EGTKGAVFDDVQVRNLARLRFDRPCDVRQLGHPVSGAWQTRAGSDGGTRIVPDGDDCLLLFGSSAWTGGAVTAEVRPGDGRCGLVAGADGDRRYLLSLSPDGRGALIEQNGGAEKTLVEFDHSGAEGTWQKVGLNLSDPGLVAAYVGGGLVARAKIKGSPSGRIGLFAREPDDVAFRNLVANRSTRLLAKHQIGNAIFLSDAYMSSWATEQGQWIPNDGPDRARSMPGYRFAGQNEFWRKGDYYGDYTMVLPLTIAVDAGDTTAHTPIKGSLGLHFCLKSGDLQSGYSVTATAVEDGTFEVVLRRKKDVVEKVTGVSVGAGAHEVDIYNSGRYIWAEFGGEELFSYRKQGNGSGTRIAAVRQGAVDFERLAVYAENLDDTAFERAPTHWRLMGDWRILRRFECDPRWSWMGVESLRGHAAMWHRRQFPGDLTIELYASMKMRPGRVYYCPSDLNLTFAADRESPESGYSIIVGGWKNEKTAILREGKVVAETDKKYLPDTRDSYPSSAMLHRRWFYIKVRRKGPKIELYLDNEKYLEYTDPEPLTGGKLAVWTQEQSILVARAQVYYSKSLLPGQTVPEPERPLPEPPAGRPLRVTSKNRRSYFFGFETGTQGWADGPATGGNAMPVWDPTTAATGRASLKLVNAECGGRFLTTIPIQQVNLAACPVLSFDYKIPRGVHLNLYFDVDRAETSGRHPARVTGDRARRRGRRRRGGARKRTVPARTYFIPLTGPTRSTEPVKRAGQFKRVTADDRWHHARVDIGTLMREFYPIESNVVARNFRLALDHRGTYALSGIGGNRRGATYHIDNFLIAEAGTRAAAFQWRPCREPHAGYAYAVSDRPDADPGERPNLADPYVSVDPKPGLRFFHVRPVLKSAAGPRPPAHVAFYNVGEKIRVTKMDPPDGAKWGGGPIRIHFPPDQARALDAGSIALVLGDVRLRLDGRALSMDWRDGVLTVDPSECEAEFEDQEVVSCSLQFRSLNEKEPDTVAWQYVASRASDVTPPSAVRVEGGYEADDFETDLDPWYASGHTACVIDRSTAASGKGSLKVCNTANGGNFLLYRPIGNRRVGECARIEFDYKAGPSVRPDFILSAGGRYSFKFFDRTPANRVGVLPDIQADDQWHHVSLDTFAAFWKSHRHTLSSRLSWIGFGDYGWASSREGDCYHIDNFRVLPVASCRDGLEVNWSAHDPLGVAGCGFKWSAKPQDTAPRKLMATGGTIRAEGLPEGRMYLHLRAVDLAGNWGPVSHYAYLIDSTPPAVDEKQIRPRPGKRICPRRFTVTIKDDHGPDPSQLRLKVDERTFTFGSPSLQNARRPSIAWDLALTPEAITPIPNGKELAFSLTGVQDFAGNTAPTIQGKWIMDHRLDRQPPQRVEIDPASADVALARRFDRNLEHTRQYRYVYVRHHLATEPASHCMQFAPRLARDQLAILRHKPIDLSKTGVIKLDIHMPKPRSYMDLLLVGQQFKAKLRMGDKPPGEPKPGKEDRDGFVFLGAMNHIRAADGWHTQWADLHAMLQKAMPKLTSFQLRSIRIGRACQPFTRARHTYIDNILVYGYENRKMELKLRSRDITGLSGFAVRIDKEYAGLPKKEVNHKGEVLKRTLKPGVWYVKALARDNNGNWSRVVGVLPCVVK